jgi:hypothetical protein
MKRVRKKKKSQMDEVSKNYESFIANKETNNNNKEIFEQALKKAAKPKPRGSK